MQPKESKSNHHFIISMIKSGVRIVGYIGLILAFDNILLTGGGLLLIAAEVLGILEEMF